MALSALLSAAPAHAIDDGSCSSWLAPDEIAGVSKSGLNEVSGVAASHAYPGLLWMHNDSGGNSSLYAVDILGESRGSWSVLGAENEDWEDIALGPCASESDGCTCIYLADIGDNDEDRGDYVLYRVPEPDAAATTGGQTPLAEAIWFQYPDGPRDAEALAIDPMTGETWIFTKEPGRSEVYVFPDAPPQARSASDPYTLTLHTTLALDALEDPQITGADASPRGARLVLRSDADLLVYGTSGGGLAEALSLGATPLPSLEADGEAAAWSPEGEAIYLINEEAEPALWVVECANFASDGLGDDDPLICGDEEGGCGGCGAVGADEPGIAWLFVIAGTLVWRRRVEKKSRR